MEYYKVKAKVKRYKAIIKEYQRIRNRYKYFELSSANPSVEQQLKTLTENYNVAIKRIEIYKKAHPELFI